MKRPGLTSRWIAAGIVGIITAVIALAHTGLVSEEERIVIVPFQEYGPHITCLVQSCSRLKESLRFLLVNGLGNICVFIPLGLSLGVAVGSTVKSKLRLVGIVGMAGIAVSALLELGQLWIPGRVFATDDIVMNGTGVWIGAALVVVVLNKPSNGRRQSQRE